MSSANHDDLGHLKIPLENILFATNNFGKENLTEEADFGNAYQGQLSWSGELTTIDARRFNKEWSEREQEFWMEILMLSGLKHKNLVSLVGFCDENDEKIIIIKNETRGSLDNYLSDPVLLTWVKRLEICVGLANALSYIHYDEEGEFSVIHRNIDSLNVLLNDNWEPKLSGFRLSMKIEASQRHDSFCVDKVWDREGYTDPTYIETKSVSHKSDIYSFGIVMFELLCARKSIIANDTNQYLAPTAIRHYKEKTLDDIIDWNLLKQMDSQSFNIFAETAYACLNEERSQRPNIDEIVTKLEKALELALVNKHGRSHLVSSGGKGPQQSFTRTNKSIGKMVNFVAKIGSALNIESGVSSSKKKNHQFNLESYLLSLRRRLLVPRRDMKSNLVIVNDSFNQFSKVREIVDSDSDEEEVVNTFDESVNLFGGGHDREDDYDDYASSREFGCLL